MRLQTKTNLLYFCLFLLIVVVGGFLYFFLVKGVLDEEIEERLQVRKQRIEERFEGAAIGVSDEVLQQITPVNDSIQITESMKDTLIFDAYDDEYIPYRQLTFLLASNDRNYRVVLRQSLVEPEDLLESVQLSMIAVLAVLLGGFWLLNALVVRKLWAPFRGTLGRLRKHSFLSEKPLELPKSSTTEFQELNDTVETMAKQIQRDMQKLKEFAENASHEMQTPLAIIVSKLEGLSDDTGLDEQQIGSIRVANRAAAKLSSLNKTLLLLTRIEGTDYLEKETINIVEDVEAVLADYADLLLSKELRVERVYTGSLIVDMNRILARILTSNLLKNAVVHSDRGGVIRITAGESALAVENTGRPLRCAPEALFERFKKNDQTYPSLGLGLSIVKSICDMNHFSVSYTNQRNTHTLTVVF